MKPLIGILVTLLIMSISCNNKKRNIPRELKINEDISCQINLVKEKEVKIDTTKKRIPAIAKIIDNSHVYITLENTDKNLEVLVYNTELEYKKKYLIPYGQGPLECLMPIILGGEKNKIIVFDNITKKYYLYNDRFNSRENLKTKTKEINWIPHGSNFSPKHNAFLICLADAVKPDTFQYHLYIMKINGYTAESKMIFKIDNNFRTKEGLFISAHPIHFSLIDNYVFVLKPSNYHLIKMALDGTIVNAIRVVNLKDVRFGKQKRGQWIEEGGSNKLKFTLPENLWHACWIMKFGDGIAVGRRENYKPVSREWGKADYFDRELNYLGKITLPWFPRWNKPAQLQSDIFFYSKGNKLFHIEIREKEDEEEFWLTRWRIEK